LNVLKSKVRIAKRRYAFDDNGFDDRKVVVVIVMHENVEHSRNLAPRDVGRGAIYIGIDVLDRLAKLHQSRSGRVIGDTLVEVTFGDVLVDRVNGVFDVR
jgi:hypothetical protein